MLWESAFVSGCGWLKVDVVGESVEGRIVTNKRQKNSSFETYLFGTDLDSRLSRIEERRGNRWISHRPLRPLIIILLSVCLAIKSKSKAAPLWDISSRLSPISTHSNFHLSGSSRILVKNWFISVQLFFPIQFISETRRTDALRIESESMESERQEESERSFPVKMKAEAINQNIDFLLPLLTQRRNCLDL